MTAQAAPAQRRRRRKSASFCWSFPTKPASPVTGAGLARGIQGTGTPSLSATRISPAGVSIVGTRSGSESMPSANSNNRTRNSNI
jgi:hypothetical protein